MAARCDLLITGVGALVDADTLIEDAVIAIAGGALCEVAPRAGRRVDDRTDPDFIEAARRLHLPGRLALPGLINIHTHAALCMLRGVAEDLGFAPAYTPGVPGGALLTPMEACALARLGALEALRFGSTTIVDTYVHAAHTLPAMTDLGLRVCGSPRIHDADLARLAQRQWHFDPKIGAATLGEAVALAERYPDAPDQLPSVHFAAHAPDTCSPAMLAQVREAATRLNRPVATHLAQSRSEVDVVRAREGCSPAQFLDRAGLLGPQLIAAHGIHLDADDIALCGARGVTIAHIPKGNATGGQIAPTRALAQAGARLTLGTDNMHADLIEVMRWALALGRVQAGGVADDWQPAHVFAMATSAGAQALGWQDRLGTLHAGKRADLVVVDARALHLAPRLRPLGALVHTGQGRDVEYVVVEGEVVIAEGEPTRARSAEVVAEAQAAAEAVWRRAGGLPPAMVPRAR
jgi:5-methylthioadenosine/S-adenosylhomocysteine deaminase